MLAALVMLSLLQGSVYASEPYFDKETNSYYANGNNVVIGDGDNYDYVYGNGGTKNPVKSINGANVTVNGGYIGAVIGAYGNAEYMNENNIVINGGIIDSVQGIYNSAVNGLIQNNNINIENVYGLSGFFGVEVAGGNITENKITVNNLTNNLPFDFIGVQAFEANESFITDNEINVKDGNYHILVGFHGQNAEITDNKLTISCDTEVDTFLQFVTSNVLNGNVLTLDGESKIHNGMTLALGFGEASKIYNNDLILKGNSKVEDAQLYGFYAEDTIDGVGGFEDLKKPLEHKDNSLIIDGWKGKNIAAVNYFDDIEFKNFKWDTSKTKENALVVITGKSDLSETDININRDNDGNNGIKLNGGQTINSGDSMTLIYNANGLGDIAALEGGKEITTNLSVATALDAVIEQSEDKNSVNLTAKEIKLADQTMLVAENRAVAAAFVNQGTDLIADSLDTLSRDGKYGVKTFAAVHGNRSKYDVNSDIKINGWSTIVGVGSETEHNGGDFSWGVFYENGSGNYRTFNSFNNEYFRGDGSLVYNGGGIAARYENAHGVYTEGSLRAGMLKSDMDNALSDGENKYGYSSESEYYNTATAAKANTTARISVSVKSFRSVKAAIWMYMVNSSIPIPKATALK